MDKSSQTAGAAPGTEKQSTVGIASMIIALIGLIFLLLFIAFFAYVSSLGPQSDVMFSVANCAIGMTVIIALIAGGAGLINRSQHNRKQNLGRVGLILSAVILVGSLGFYAWTFLTRR